MNTHCYKTSFNNIIKIFFFEKKKIMSYSVTLKFGVMYLFQW